MRERILAAALTVLRDSGIRQFTQVEVAERAGVRQSHLTYYFPTRHDLLEATTMRAVDAIACGIGRAVREQSADAEASLLARLTRAVTDTEHMRMFLGVIVAADRDTTLRAIVGRGARRLEISLADALGGPDSAERARITLAMIWGLGLYAFAVRPSAEHDPAPRALAWLEDMLRSRRGSRAAK